MGVALKSKRSTVPLLPAIGHPPNTQFLSPHVPSNKMLLVSDSFQSFFKQGSGKKKCLYMLVKAREH